MSLRSELRGHARTNKTATRMGLTRIRPQESAIKARDSSTSLGMTSRNRHVSQGSDGVAGMGSVARTAWTAAARLRGLALKSRQRQARPSG